jgi:crossover junction endodeoxyribonuclease RuvC
MGIDPGSRITGYGVIDMEGSHSRHIASGCIQTASSRPLPERLKMIFEGVAGVVQQYQPAEVAALSRCLCTAIPIRRSNSVRRAARRLCAVVMAGLPVSEYAARAIKQAVVGSGAADKAQVQHMVALLLNLPELPRWMRLTPWRWRSATATPGKL